MYYTYNPTEKNVLLAMQNVSFQHVTAIKRPWEMHPFICLKSVFLE